VFDDDPSSSSDDEVEPDVIETEDEN
jgi:hypothetical protein